MFSCNTTSDSYCCDDGCSCDAGNEVVSFTGTPYTLTVIDVASTFPNPSASTGTTATSTPNPSASTSTTATSTPNPSESTSTTAITTSSPESAPSTASPAGVGESTTSASSPISSQHQSSNSVAIGVGVGVGIGVAILLLGVGGLWFYYRHLRALRSQQPLLDKDFAGHPAYPMESTYPVAGLKPLPHTPQYGNKTPSTSGDMSELSTSQGRSELGTTHEHSQSAVKAGTSELP